MEEEEQVDDHLCCHLPVDRTPEWEGWELRPAARKQNPPGVFFFFVFFPCTSFNRSSCKLPLGLFRSLNLHSQITPLKRKLFSVFLRVFINKEGIFIVEQLVISSEHIQKK